MAKEQGTVEQPYDPMKDMVTVTLPRATGREEGTVFVGLNGKGYNLKKGTTIQVPRPVYDILDEANRQRERQAAYEEMLQKQAEDRARQYGLFG